MEGSQQNIGWSWHEAVDVCLPVTSWLAPVKAGAIELELPTLSNWD